MKMGMRKPSIKKSFKARTTGKAKRAIKKAVIPGYGKKGMGWVKDPKKAAYNKVYNKTTFCVNDVARAVAGTSSTKSKSTKKYTNSVTKTSARQSKSNTVKTATATKQKLNYNVLVYAKPVVTDSIIVGVVGIAVFFFSKIIGAIILAIALYLFYDYKHRTATNEYISDQDLADWISTLKKYYGNIEINGYSQALDYTKKLLANQYQDLKKYYDALSDKKELAQKDRLSLIQYSNIVLDFEKYVTYNISDVRFQSDRIQQKREQAACEYIDTEYQKSVDHAATLKTEKGKLNQLEKFKSILLENLSPIYPQYEEYVNETVEENDFLN